MNNIQNIFQIVLLMFLSTILFGCQSVPRIHSIVDKAAQFDGYATYGFHPTLLPKKDEYDSLSYRYIKSAIHNEMLNKGYKYALEPELWVNFNVYVKDKIKISLFRILVIPRLEKIIPFKELILKFFFLLKIF